MKIAPSLDLVVGAGRGKSGEVDMKLSGFPRTLFFPQFRASIFRHKKTKAKTAVFLVINQRGLGKITKASIRGTKECISAVLEEMILWGTMN